MTGCIFLSVSRNIAHVAFRVLTKFSFQIFDRNSEINWSSAAFRFLILIHFMYYSFDIDAKFP